MRLLVLGGSVFLSHAVAAEAASRGHDVAAACRGVSGPLPAGVRHVPLDRTTASTGDVAAAVGPGWDTVVDVARHPSRVRAAVAATPEAHWVFVSTVNVYPDTSTPGGRPDTLPLHEPVLTDEDPAAGPDVYGAMKVGCEQLVREGAASSVIVRPGLVVGPGDPTGRFSYWPWRLDPDRTDAGDPAGDPVLAPGDPGDLVQVIDVRDLAAWLVDLAETRATGTFDGVGGPAPRAALLAAVADGCGSRAPMTWVDQEFLVAQEVEPWAGDRSVPLWLPQPEYAGMLAHDPTPSLEAGLRLRPVAESAADTMAWLRETPDAEVTGLTRDEERALLEAWGTRG